MTQEKYCQSCGMPMGQGDELYGTEKDGSKSADYCKYCYQNGAYTFKGTMQQMIDFCVKPMLDENPKMTEAEAREMMNKYFPMLKRWQKA
jgi:hypothetical protein